MKYIMCAKTFPVFHPRMGQPTKFKESILSGKKIHTLRNSSGNRKTGDTVSLREWASVPYGSKQIEFAQCTIRVEPVSMSDPCFGDMCETAKNDGLSHYDFQMWFTHGLNVPIQFEGVRIWFHDVKEIK